MTEPISQPTSTESSVAAERAAQALNGAAELPRSEWPSSDELIFDDGIPMETARHFMQMSMLIDTLAQHWADRHDFYVGGNNFVYFSPNQVKNEDFRGPDVFVVLGVDGRRERKGWVVWEEGGKTPDVIIELLSESTADFDRNQKKEIYRTKLGAPEYYLYDPFSAELEGFISQNQTYVPLVPDERGRLISPALGLALARWDGEYRGVQAIWLRWETLDGGLLPTSPEHAAREQQRADQAEQHADQAQQRADQAQQRADQAQQRADQERQRAEQAQQHAEQERRRAEQAEALAARERERIQLLNAKLRELGIDPESLK